MSRAEPPPHAARPFPPHGGDLPPPLGEMDSLCEQCRNFRPATMMPLPIPFRQAVFASPDFPQPIASPCSSSIIPPIHFQFRRASTASSLTTPPFFRDLREWRLSTFRRPPPCGFPLHELRFCCFAPLPVFHPLRNFCACRKKTRVLRFLKFLKARVFLDPIQAVSPSLPVDAAVRYFFFWNYRLHSFFPPPKHFAFPRLLISMFHCGTFPSQHNAMWGSCAITRSFFPRLSGALLPLFQP